MNSENSEFESERLKRINDISLDNKFKSLSIDWMNFAAKNKYTYNFDFLGRPIIQYPQDMVAIQEIIWKVKPDLIIETGVAHGGSLIMSAGMLAILDVCDAIKNQSILDLSASNRRVIGIDVDIRKHNLEAITNHPLFYKINLIEGSSTDPTIVNEVKNLSRDFNNIMVMLDSNHTKSHVISELNFYAQMTSIGSYCIVFDTAIEITNPEYLGDRPWGVGNNPDSAVRQFLDSNPGFEIDESFYNKLQISNCHTGFLIRKS